VGQPVEPPPEVVIEWPEHAPIPAGMPAPAPEGVPTQATAEVAPGSVVTLPTPRPPPPSVAWVLDQPDLDRSRRLATKVEAWTGLAAQPLGSRWCVAFPDPPSSLLLRKVTRRQGTPPEERRDCDVAWFPMGRGYLAAIVEPPGVGVEEVLGGLHLGFQEVRRSSDPAQPIRVCAPMGAIGEPWMFSQHLVDNGLVVRAMYDVGACAR
jgi:hypothetical protein